MMFVSVLLLLVAIFFSVTGELLLKMGMNKVGLLAFNLDTFLPTLVRTFTTSYIILGLSSIVVSLIFWLSVLSRVPLSVAYPMVSLSYLLVVVGSWIFLGEHVNLMRIVGVGVIMMGVFVVSRSY
ncbi:MAG: EamA family transporter [Chloroflexi bacterium]|nr:EamA family transporter [Chloroflexota bacterium]